MRVKLVKDHCEALTIDWLDSEMKEVGSNECHKMVDNNKQKAKEEIVKKEVEIWYKQKQKEVIVKLEQAWSPEDKDNSILEIVQISSNRPWKYSPYKRVLLQKQDYDNLTMEEIDRVESNIFYISYLKYIKSTTSMHKNRRKTW